MVLTLSQVVIINVMTSLPLTTTKQTWIVSMPQKKSMQSGLVCHRDRYCKQVENASITLMVRRAIVKKLK